MEGIEESRELICEKCGAPFIADADYIVCDKCRGEINRETCCECGRSVAWGSGRFVNRVPVLDDREAREEHGRPYPDGEWMCPDCDEAANDIEYDDEGETYSG